MAFVLAQTKTALGPALTASFLASGGTSPYAYAVVPGGAGGSIDPGTGLYTAPAVASSDPKFAYDTIQVTDSTLVTPLVTTLRILVANPLLLFCEIIEKELGLVSGRVFLWKQKVFQPTDSGLYIAVSVPMCRPFANINRPDPVTGDAVQSVNVAATLDLDIMSRGPEARDRKEEVVMAFNSQYAQFQQEANSFYIGKLPARSQFLDLSVIDGAAIPYRYRISVQLHYMVVKSKAVDIFDTFQDVQLTTEP